MALIVVFMDMLTHTSVPDLYYYYYGLPRLKGDVGNNSYLSPGDGAKQTYTGGRIE